MIDLHLEFVRWPVGTTVGLYQRKSELMLDNQPPPLTPLIASATVLADSSLHFTGLPESDAQYWAIAPDAGGVFRYVGITTERPSQTIIEAEIDQLQADVDAIETDVAQLETHDVVVDSAINALQRALGFDARTGLLAPSSRGWGLQKAAIVGPRTYLCRFVSPVAFTARRIRFFLETSGGIEYAVEAGIYQARPMPSGTLDRLATSGATAGQLVSTGRKTITIPDVPIQPMIEYYAALATQNAGGTTELTAVSWTSFPGVHSVLAVDGAATAGTIGHPDISATNDYPLPATVDLVATPAANTGVPILAVME